LREAWLDDKGRLALRASLLFAPDNLISPSIIAKATILPTLAFWRLSPISSNDCPFTDTKKRLKNDMNPES